MGVEEKAGMWGRTILGKEKSSSTRPPNKVDTGSSSYFSPLYNTQTLRQVLVSKQHT